MKNDLQHITFGKVLNFCNIYVATKSFSEHAYDPQDMQALTSCIEPEMKYP